METQTNTITQVIEDSDRGENGETSCLNNNSFIPMLKECERWINFLDECLAHELAHFLNHLQGVKDCTSNQYHNKQFKKQAETLFLKVERTNKGYAQTSETEEFKQLLTEFSPKTDVFNIIQQPKEKGKVGTRLNKWVCSCGVIVRCATELKAKCLECGGEFEKC